MTAYTLTKNTNIRDLTVADGYSARTGGDSISNTNGYSFTIDQDTQYGYGSPAIGATSSGSLGSITQTAASGGDIFIDATKVWLIPFNTGSGTLAPSAAGVTISGATANTIAVYTALNAAPATTGASGWLKVTNVSGTLPSSGSFTSDGFTYTITGAPVRGWIEVVGDDAATITLVRLGRFQVRGAYYEIGTTDGNRATTYQVPNNGKQLYLPSIEVQGQTWTITGATWANGVATYTTSATHDMLVGQPVTVTGITPSGYNVTDEFITDITDITFKVAIASDPGSYTSGGSAIAYEQYPCAGTLTCTAANWYPNENTRRGKVFWNTNATTSLTLPTGVVRFGHDGTNSAGAYCPPSGRKIRIPNIFFTNCTTAARNQNVLPNATLATRYDFTTTGAGRIDIDKATMCWFPSIAQAYECKITNSGIMSQVNITEVPTQIVMKNVAIGQEAAVVAVLPVTSGLNTGGMVLHNVVGTQAGTTGTTSANCFNINTASNVEIVDCVGWCYAFRTGTAKQHQFSLLPGLKLTRFHTIGLSIILLNCSDIEVTDTKWTDTTGTRQSTQNLVVFQPQGGLTSGTISGLEYVGYRAQNWAQLVSPATNLRGPLSVRNLGSDAAPLETGDGPYYDKSWSRTTTTCTVTHTAHGLLANDPIVVFYVSSTGAISIGAKTVATVPTADTFTFSCTNGGDASGALSYFFCPLNGVIPNASGSNYTDIRFQRCYPKFSRAGGAGAAENSNEGILFETSYVTHDLSSAGYQTISTLNTLSKFSFEPGNASAVSVYGTTWADGPRSALPDTDTYTWSRSSSTITATTSTGYINNQPSTSIAVEVSGSDSESALNNGFYNLLAPATGDTANKLRVTGYAAGAASGNATINFETGRVCIYMNEGTTENTHYTITAGSPTFTGSGLLRMPNVGDQIVFETPYWIKGHTGFMTTPPSMMTATQANFNIEYQIDTGSGYSAWKTAFRQTATAVANGTAGAATIVQVAAGDNWIADGNYVQTTIWGEVNRVAKVSSGGGTTTLTMDKNHNATFTNRALQVFNLPNENASINWETGFKLKVRITTLIAGTGASNTVGPLHFKTFTTAASRELQLPLDTNTVTFTGLPTGCDAFVLTAGTSTLLDQQDALAGTTYSYTYSGAQTVDVGFIKAGYVPFYIRNLSLTTTDSSIPVSLTLDRNYA